MDQLLLPVELPQHILLERPELFLELRHDCVGLMEEMVGLSSGQGGNAIAQFNSGILGDRQPFLGHLSLLFLYCAFLANQPILHGLIPGDIHGLHLC